MAPWLSRSALAGAVLLLAPSPSAQIVHVQGGGLALQNSVQGAAPGTTFIVQPGRYSNFRWTAIDATVIAPQRATIAGYFSVDPQAGSLTMKNIDVVGSTRSTGYGTYPDPGVISSFGPTIVLDNCKCEALYAQDCHIAVSNSRIAAWENSVDLRRVSAVFTDTAIFGGFFFSYYGFSSPENAVDLFDCVVRMERVTVQAGSISSSRGPSGAGIGLSIGGDSVVTVADSRIEGGPGSPFSYPTGTSVSVWGAASKVTLSSTTTVGPISGSITRAPLATAEWVTSGLTLGGTVTARFTDTPSVPVLVLLSWDFVGYFSPLVAEPLFIFATPSWHPLVGGFTNAQGEFDLTVTLPSAPGALQYQPIWFTGVFGGTFPFRSTAPLGGIVE